MTPLLSNVSDEDQELEDLAQTYEQIIEKINSDLNAIEGYAIEDTFDKYHVLNKILDVMKRGATVTSILLGSSLADGVVKESLKSRLDILHGRMFQMIGNLRIGIDN